MGFRKGFLFGFLIGSVAGSLSAPKAAEAPASEGPPADVKSGLTQLRWRLRQQATEAMTAAREAAATKERDLQREFDEMTKR